MWVFVSFTNFFISSSLDLPKWNPCFLRAVKLLTIICVLQTILRSFTDAKMQRFWKEVTDTDSCFEATKVRIDDDVTLAWRIKCGVLQMWIRKTHLSRLPLNLLFSFLNQFNLLEQLTKAAWKRMITSWRSRDFLIVYWKYSWNFFHLKLIFIYRSVVKMFVSWVIIKLLNWLKKLLAL